MVLILVATTTLADILESKASQQQGSMQVTSVAKESALVPSLLPGLSVLMNEAILVPSTLQGLSVLVNEATLVPSSLPGLSVPVTEVTIMPDYQCQ